MQKVEGKNINVDASGLAVRISFMS